MDIVHLIQSAVAPVFLLSGVGVTLGVLTGRLARIIDRARYLEDHPTASGLRPEAIQKDLRMLARRARYTNSAIAMCAASALFVSLVVMALFASAFLDRDMSLPIAILFVGAMICLTGAFGAFLVECRLATQILRFGTSRQPGTPLRREPSWPALRRASGTLAARVAGSAPRGALINAPVSATPPSPPPNPPEKS